MIAIAIVFVSGLATTVISPYAAQRLRFRRVGKDRFEAEQVLGDGRFEFCVRATRPSNQVNADTVCFSYLAEGRG